MAPKKDDFREKIDQYLLLPLVLAASVGLAAWVMNTGNRVSAMEVQLPTMQEDVKVIRDDVREIRNWLQPKSHNEK